MQKLDRRAKSNLGKKAAAAGPFRVDGVGRVRGGSPGWPYLFPSWWLARLVPHPRRRSRVVLDGEPAGELPRRGPRGVVEVEAPPDLVATGGIFSWLAGA